MKLSTAIRHFDEQMRADGKSPRTREVYLRDLDVLKCWFLRDVKISTVTLRHIAVFLTSKSCTQIGSGKPKAVASLNRTKSALRSFFRFTVDSGYLKNNPARLIKSARINPRPPSVLSTPEIRRLFRTIKRDRTAIAQRDYLIFSVLLGTGMRLGSLVGLHVEDIDYSGGTVRIRAKGGVERVAFLTTVMSRQLRRHLKNRYCANEAVFLSTQGRAIGSRQVQLRFAMWLEKARISKRYSVHSLRHTFATRLYKSTKDLRLVQVALGHRRASTTEIYTQVADSMVRQAVCAASIVNG